MDGKGVEKSSIESVSRESLKGLQHPTEYLRFISWIVAPEPLRDPKTQGELAKELKVSEQTLSEWKKRPGFWSAVQDEMRHFMRSRTANVMGAFYNAIIREGDAARIRTWWEIVEGWTPKQKVAFAGALAVEQVRSATNEELYRIIELAEAFRRGESGDSEEGDGEKGAAQVHPVQLPGGDI